jgi:hypothetical protein
MPVPHCVGLTASVALLSGLMMPPVQSTLLLLVYE